MDREHHGPVLAQAFRPPQWTLDPALYWRWRAMAADVQIRKAEAAALIAQAELAVLRAQATETQAIAAVTAAHPEIVADRRYRLDDRALTVTEEPAGT
jgi:hypothetical protein